ncbi:hypothetical protein TKK_0011288 [Trichogramma kaykai]
MFDISSTRNLGCYSRIRVSQAVVAPVQDCPKSNSVAGVYPCSKCGKVYKWYRNLTTHLRLECGKEPRVICPFCPRRTKHKTSMRTHIKRMHNVTF